MMKNIRCRVFWRFSLPRIPSRINIQKKIHFNRNLDVDSFTLRWFHFFLRNLNGRLNFQTKRSTNEISDFRSECENHLFRRIILKKLSIVCVIFQCPAAGFERSQMFEWEIMKISHRLSDDDIFNQ